MLVSRVALYCGLSRFRNFALWSQRGAGREQGGESREAGANWKGGTEVVPDFEYDHSLRPPHAKISRTPLVFTQRHRLAELFHESKRNRRKEEKRERGRRWTSAVDTRKRGAEVARRGARRVAEKSKRVK